MALEESGLVFCMAESHANHPVILSGVAASRSEAAAESKDPDSLTAVQSANRSSDEVAGPSEQTSHSASLTPAGILLQGLIDYAGLFPPAALPMARAVANYDAYSRSQFGWILGRFILPAARLDAFKSALATLSAASDRPPLRWGLSALIGPDLAADLARIREFNIRSLASASPDAAVVESAEVKASSPQEIENLARVIPAELETYIEIPWSSPAAVLQDCIAAVAARGRRAKIRTGGETVNLFPSPETIVEFIELCAAADVPFKATAGLHHPLRSLHRLTYQPDSPSGIMHGFLNVFLAAAFVRAGIESRLAVEVLKEEAAVNFDFDSEGVAWRSHRLSEHDLAASRKHLATSVGSCSFTEPIDDLRLLHLL